MIAGAPPVGARCAGRPALDRLVGVTRTPWTLPWHDPGAPRRRGAARATFRPLLLAVVLASCAERVLGPQAPSDPSTLIVRVGDNQRGEVGSELPDLIELFVCDLEGLPVPGVPVRFQVTAGRGGIVASQDVSDSRGLVSVRWKLGPSASDSQRLETRVRRPAGKQLVATVRATAVPAAPAALE